MTESIMTDSSLEDAKAVARKELNKAAVYRVTKVNGKTVMVPIDVVDLKKRGRPATGVGTPVQVRLNAKMLKYVDTVARIFNITRPAAIRRIIETDISRRSANVADMETHIIRNPRNKNETTS